MKYRLKAYSIYELGARKNQEDSIYPAHGSVRDEDRLFILCDGMGGHDSGEVASSAVCEAMSASVLSELKVGGTDAERKNMPDSFTDEDFRKAMAAALSYLDSKDTGAEKKMGTTMTFLKFHDEGATVAHIGDSRVYHIRPGGTAEDTGILYVTRDHSLVNELVKIGELTPEEAKHSRQKNVITRAMQPHQERPPKADIHHTSDIVPGDYFFLCSDGMLEETEDSDLRAIFSESGGDDEDKVRALTELTQDNKDNHSAFIIHILDVDKESAAPCGSISPETGKEEAAPVQMESVSDVNPPSETVRENPAAEGGGSDALFWKLVCAGLLLLGYISYCLAGRFL